MKKRLILAILPLAFVTASHAALYQFKLFGTGSVTQFPESDPVWEASIAEEVKMKFAVELGELEPTLANAFSVVPDFLFAGSEPQWVRAYSGNIGAPGTIVVSKHPNQIPWANLSNDGTTTSWTKSHEEGNGIDGWNLFAGMNANGYWHSIQDPEGILDSYEFSATWDHSLTKVRAIERVPDSVSSFSALACAIFGVLIFSRNGPLRKRHA